MALTFRQIDGTAPTFVKKPAIRQEEDGKKLIFECQIKADPGPSVSWSHNSENVKEGPRHKVRVLSIVEYVEGANQILITRVLIIAEYN